MLIKDLIKIYIASRETKIEYGQTEPKYINPFGVTANMQYMSNREEQKTYGVITNSIVVIETDMMTGAEIKRTNINDGIYLNKPVLDGYGDIQDEPDYHILSIKTGFIGVTAVRNPVIITARLNNDRNKN